MFDDFKDLIELLNKHKARYLVIGGYAVGAHAQPLVTKDLDILILPAPKNAGHPGHRSRVKKTAR
jgi:hypothetical protein